MRSVLCLAIVSAACLGMAGEDKSVEKLLTKMRTNYRAVKSAVFTTNGMRLTQNGKKSQLRSETQFIAPKKVYSKIVGAKSVAKEPVAFVTDGRLFSVQGIPGRGRVEKFVPNQTQLIGLVPLNLESLCFWDYAIQLNNSSAGNMAQSKLSLESDTWKGKKWTILREKAQGLDIRYFIDPQSLFIWRTVVKRSVDNMVVGDYYLETLKINTAVSPSLFAALQRG